MLHVLQFGMRTSFITQQPFEDHVQSVAMNRTEPSVDKPP